MNRLTELFKKKDHDLLNIYSTAGYPQIDSITDVLKALQANSVDIVEIGIPYSDPIADGPVIQQSNMKALANGIDIATLFKQLKDCRTWFDLPLILMGYLNPVMQYGFEKFCIDAKAIGADAVILPDLPMFEYEKEYKKYLKENDLHAIFLITPETSDDRIKKIDELSTGFIYAVSSSSTTGDKEVESHKFELYLKKLKMMNLTNPILVGFGIKDKASYETACSFTNGAIIGSAYIKILENSKDIMADTTDFISGIRPKAFV